MQAVLWMSNKTLLHLKEYEKKSKFLATETKFWTAVISIPPRMETERTGKEEGGNKNKKHIVIY